MTRALVFANGDLVDPLAVERARQPGDLIVAADGGLRHTFAFGLMPDLVVGDLDSAANELLQLVRSRSASAEVISHPVRKDKTDLELALDVLVERGVDEAIVLGALGGRLDHALANVLLLSGPIGSRLRLTMIEADYRLAVTKDRIQLHGSPGNIVTLLALTDEVTGVRTAGLEYALHDGTLRRGSSRGVSNVMTGSEASVSIDDGRLLVVSGVRPVEAP